MYHLDPEIYFSFWIRMRSSCKKTKEKEELLTDDDMLSMVEKQVRGGICHSIHQFEIINI